MSDVFDTIRHVMHRLPETMVFDEVRLYGMKTDFELAPSQHAPDIHLLAEVFAKKLQLVARHGIVRILTKGEAQTHEHAWLSLRKDLEDFIIDIRPVAMEGGPMILLNHSSRSFIPGIYKRPEGFEAHFDTIREHVCQILSAKENREHK